MRSDSAFTIKGAGVAGLCLAKELSDRGETVNVIDPAGTPGQHSCSWWAGGMLAPDCEGESAPESVTRLGKQAADWWSRQGIDVSKRGTLVLTQPRDRHELKRHAKLTKGHVELDAAAINALEPQLENRFTAGLFFKDEAHLNPRDALTTLASSVSINSLASAPVNGAIDCRGLAARDVLTDLRGVRGEMLILKCPSVHLTRPIRLLHPRIPLYIVPRNTHEYMLGATMIESDGRHRVTVRSLLELLTAAYTIDPAFGEAEVLEIGVDARPTFPDNQPRVVARHGNLYLNGLFRHGYLMAPVLAQTAADYLLSGVKGELFLED